MPPQNPDEPGRVEVALSFLSGQDSAAFTQMTEAYKQARLMFEAFKASSFTEQAEKLVKLTDQMNRSTENLRRIEDDSRQMQQRGGGLLGGIEQGIDAARRAAGRPTAMPQDEARSNVREADREFKETNSEKEERRREKERERLEAMSDEMREAERRRQQSQIADPAARERLFPSVTDPNQDPNAFVNRIETLKGEETGFRIPRFGELNVQDIFNELRDRRVRQALEATDEADARGHLEAAARYQRRSDTAGIAYGGIQAYQRIIRPLAQFGGITPMAWETQGAALGFDRTSGFGQDFLGVPLPFQTPFSASGREGERQWRDTIRNRLMPGINQEQAEAITAASAQAGFSGQRGTDIRNQFMAPLVQRTGVSPEALIPFTQTLRTGTGSVQEMSKALADLGEMARTAQVDVNTYAEALAASGEAAQQSGGYFNSGVQFGRQFTMGTGLTPNVGNQVLQNPMSSAILGGMTGLPSFAQAAATPTQKLNASMLGMRMYYNAFAGALGTEGAGEQVTGAGGEVLGTVRGDNPAIAATASKYGVSADEAEKMLRGQGRQQQVNNLENTLQLYEQEAGGAQARGGARNTQDRAAKWAKAQDGGLTTRFNRKSGKFESKHVDETTGKVEWRADTGGVAKQFEKEVGSRTIDEMERDTKGVDRKDLIHAAHRAGIQGKELGEALDKKTPEARVKAVRSLMAEKSAEEQAKYQIAFTGPAKKFFKALVNDKGGDLGKVDWDAPSNTAAASSRGPSPLSDLGNSGLGPLDTQGG